MKSCSEKIAAKSVDAKLEIIARVVTDTVQLPCMGWHGCSIPRTIKTLCFAFRPLHIFVTLVTNLLQIFLHTCKLQEASAAAIQI